MSDQSASRRCNHLGQPIGDPVHGWTVPPVPRHDAMEGAGCRVVPLDPDAHGRALWDAFALDREGRNWTYLLHGPYDSYERFDGWLRQAASTTDPLFFAIVERASAMAAGVAAYLRITPAAGSIEVGHIHLSPRLQRSRAATEAMYLMMSRAFALGYRRYEWKCDALNVPSRAAADRLGFTFEGVFRQAAVYKGRNRDTAWYAVIDKDWPARQRAFEEWLAPANFDGEGRQRVRLSSLMAAHAGTTA